MESERALDILHNELRDPANSHCADCGSKSTHVNLSLGTFICNVCSDIHKDMQRRVRDIQGGDLTVADAMRMADIGNARSRRKWLAKYKPEDFREPQPGDEKDSIREFIWLKYEGNWAGNPRDYDSRNDRYTSVRPPPPASRDSRPAFKDPGPRGPPPRETFHRRPVPYPPVPRYERKEEPFRRERSSSSKSSKKKKSKRRGTGSETDSESDDEMVLIMTPQGPMRVNKTLASLQQVQQMQQMQQVQQMQRMQQMQQMQQVQQMQQMQQMQQTQYATQQLYHTASPNFAASGQFDQNGTLNPTMMQGGMAAGGFQQPQPLALPSSSRHPEPNDSEKNPFDNL
eukprot:CAMPEP_0198729304 /NCGR_PEP_ID=MMETSP1475-20131203/16853_1 /TAXON_ID= ORGANISM="Unidentified sp., Strain CCMP1999" /NCGR_SAMPLE_ID=MMETSP1475 /ASSEMBLY_ACC=CAM_ASM_001111 /LENGTH=341 /DNA_ID=CAMNT_0044491909 /DNA_START=113 /DNA_END=1138 /DNA_ORIENTATION=+